MKEHKGMGFKAAAKNIAEKGGYSPKVAAAILASSTRHASKKAHEENKNLSKVRGK